VSNVALWQYGGWIRHRDQKPSEEALAVMHRRNDDLSRYAERDE
jgi:hypothetical protein